MSEPETFLTRWARRKRDATKAAPTVEPKPDASDLPSPGDAIVPVETTGIAHRALSQDGDRTPSPAIFDPTQLPSLDSISAATDIRAFLAPGVPADLTRAALRRAWSADSAIRDFVGLADYDWDFNTPGAIPGFGPLHMTDELRRIVSDMVGRNLSLPEKDQPAATLDDEKDTGTFDNTGNSSASKTSISAPLSQQITGEVQECADSSRGCEEFAAANPDDTAVQHSNPEHVEVLPRRHGRALPK